MSEAMEIGLSPWHGGELELQRRAGVAEQMDKVGRKNVRTFLLDQHREFYPLLPFVILGSVDPEGRPWATIRSGHPGFLYSPDALTLTVRAARDANDPAERGMEDGDAIGLVGVDLITRRRNRLNGTVVRKADSHFDVSVGQSFGNCPRYIQSRHFEFIREPTETAPARSDVSHMLSEAAQQIIAKADTFFVASYVDRGDQGRQVDVSHRGGRPGFVRTDADGGLTVPDFNGNLFFNTLGNIKVNPRAGLLFFDEGTGDILQLSGRAEVILDSPEIAAFEGAERLWRVFPEKVVFRRDALPLRWRFAEDGFSPSTLTTGTWDDAGRRLPATTDAKRWRKLRVDKIDDESETIRSLYLIPSPGEVLVPHLAGQHLPIRISEQGKYIRRSYTISSAPSDSHYRLSVKKEGRASNLLHAMQPGDEIEALVPRGTFNIDAMERTRPAVLLGAGIGITPLLSMLRHIVHEGDRTRHRRPVWLFRSSRSLFERPFDEEIAALVKRGLGSIHDVTVLSSPQPGDEGHFDVAGRIDVELLKKELPFGDYDFYICGPSSFMLAIYDGLKRLNIAEDRIHAEAFGPSGLKREDTDPHDIGTTRPQPATEPTRVIFSKSGKEARWKPGDGSLLELAEKRGLSPEYGCRGGSCGDCKVRILKGKVSYTTSPSYDVKEDEALICSSVPAEGSGDLHLEA